MNANRNRNPSTTKRGPGRKHVFGHQRATPVKSSGADLGFVVRTFPAQVSPRDALIREHGRRQGIKLAKAQRRAQREMEHAADRSAHENVTYKFDGADNLRVST